MKLKTLLLLEMGMSMSPGSLSSQDTVLRPTPNLEDNNIEDWDGITEGNGWFCHKGINNPITKKSKITIYITETNVPQKIWIEIKTNGFNQNDSVNRHINKIANRWISLAKSFYKIKNFTESGNKKEITWDECFKKSIIHPKMKKYVTNWGNIPIVNPVNF